MSSPRALLAALLLGLVLIQPVRADEPPKPDDKVEMDLSAENWVTTKTARVSISVEAAVTASSAGGMRAAMMKAVDDLAKADWRLTSFDRSQDPTGMERWSSTFEARLPETALSGLHESAKKLSKAGLQLSIAAIDFSPTLEETQTTMSQIRGQIYKVAQEQLTTLNAAFPGRSFRIASITFENQRPSAPNRMLMAVNKMTRDSAGGAEGADVERSEKIVMTAHLVMAAPSPISK
jgi:hypothetical protein